MKNLGRIIVASIFVVVAYKYLNNFLNSDNKYPDVHPTLVQVVNEWEDMMKSNGIDYRESLYRIKKIEIVDKLDGRHQAGESNKRDRTIKIKSSHLDNGYWVVRATVWHELGHYIFNLEHDNSRLDIMNSTNSKEIEYKQNWDELKRNYIKSCKEHGI